VVIPSPRTTLRYGSLWKPSTSCAVYVSCVSITGVHDCAQLASYVSIAMSRSARPAADVKQPTESSRALHWSGSTALALCTRSQTESQLWAYAISNCVLCWYASVRAFTCIECER
jgi:hypothetical protein